MHGRLEYLLWAFALIFLVAAASQVFYRVAFDPTAIVVTSDPRAPWIATPMPATAEIHQWRRERAPIERFFTFFEAPVRAGPVRLRMRALGEATLFINGQMVYQTPSEAAMPRPPDNWKAVRGINVGPFLRKGRNSIGVSVRNATGPGLLSLRIDGRGVTLATGTDWLTSVDQQRPQQAILADDVRPHITAIAGEKPLAAMAEKAGSLLLFFALGALGFWVWMRFADPDLGLRLSVLAWIGVTAGWLALFLSVFVSLATRVGFDAGSHLAYVSRLSSGGGIPLATDGFATYHPPLFYAASSALAALGAGFGLSGDIGLKLLPFFSGFALVAIAWLLARRLLPDDARLHRLALVFAALLPMNLYIAAYFTNEGLHAALAAAALWWAVDLLMREHFSVRRIAVFSVLVGLALLTKFSALLVAATAGTALALRILVDERSGQGGRAAGLAALVVPALVIAGWFYVRNIVVFGEPLVGNWDFREPGQVWWSAPGFHTPAYYLGFGTSLTQPFLASFTSFWDGLYSTLWGDGLLAGQGGVAARHGLWNYSFMAAGYVLAVPATLLVIAGFVRGLGFALHDFELRRRAAFALLAVVSLVSLFAVFWLTLSLPYFGQAKAFYALMLTPVLALYFALGFGALDDGLGRLGGTPARAVLYGWLATFFGCVYLSFAP
jgi:hypothetical protein